MLRFMSFCFVYNRRSSKITHDVAIMCSHYLFIALASALSDTTAPTPSKLKVKAAYHFIPSKHKRARRIPISIDSIQVLG